MFELLNKKSKDKGFGLFITDSYVQAAQLTDDGKKITIAAAGQVSLPEGTVQNGEIKQQEALGEAINTLLKTTKPKPITDTICYVAIPELQIFEYVSIFPEDVTEKDLQKQLRSLIKETIPLKPEEVIYRYTTDVNRKERIVYTYAARKQVLKDYLRVLRNMCHLEPHVLEPESCAFARVIQDDLPAMGGTILLNERDNKIYWFVLIGNNIFESGILNINDKLIEYGSLISDLKTASNTLTTKTAISIKQIILSAEMEKQFPELRQKLTAEFNDSSINEEKYRIGNYYYKISCSMGLKSYSSGAGKEINFQN